MTSAEHDTTPDEATALLPADIAFRPFALPRRSHVPQWCEFLDQPPGVTEREGYAMAGGRVRGAGRLAPSMGRGISLGRRLRVSGEELGVSELWG